MRIRWFSFLLVALLIGSSCSLDPNTAKRKYLESGNRYFDSGKFKEASIMYRSALKKDARYGEAYYRLGLTNLKLNNVAAAERSLRRAFELLPKGSPEMLDTTGKLSDIYLVAYATDTRREKVYEGTLKDFVNLLPKNSFDRLRLEGYMAWRNRDLDTALMRFQEAGSLNPKDSTIALARAQVLIGKNQFEAAEKLVTDLIARDKKNGAAYDVLYGQYLRLNRAADAERILKDKAGNNPTVLEYRFQLAAHYFQMNRREEAARVVEAVAADSKTFPKGRERAGDFYTSVNEFERGLTFYRSALSGTKADKLDAQRKIADVLILQGKRDQALRLLENEILKENPKDDVALAQRAALWLEMGDRNQLQQAVSELETAVGKLPRNAVIRYHLGRAYWAKGEVESARAQFRAAADMQPDYLMPRLALAQIQLSRGEFATALQSADEVVALNPRSMGGRLLRSSALQGMGKFAESRTELQTILKANPKVAEVTFRLGMLEANLKNYAEAEKIFRQCIQDFTGDIVCGVGLAEVYSLRGEFDKALQLLAAERQKHPERREIQLAIANTAVVSGKYDQAATMFRELIAKEPDSSDLHLRLAETYRRKGDRAAAIDGFRKVKQMQPNHPGAGIWLALLLHQTGREAEAKVEYEQVLRLQSDNPVALNNLAFVIAEMGGDLDLALTYAQRAKQKLPQSPEVADTLGWIYTKKRLTPNAIEIYNDLVAKQPANASYRYHFGVALIQKGDKPQARRELEAALRNNPTPVEAGKIKELLSKLG